jgi:uroporphyrinogen-III synthase
MSFAGKKILSLESRRANEMATLIARYDGIPILAPSVKEKPVTDPTEALHFIAQLEAGAFNMVICMTGVGLGFMLELLTPSMAAERIAAALRQVTIVARGPKPVAILRTLNVPIEVMIPEPNTWREIVTAVTPRPERRIAIQEYGKPNPDLTRALEDLHATVTNVTFYRWELPENLAPLRSAAHGLANNEFAMVLFTSSIQLEHLLQIAEQEGIAAQVRHALQQNVRIASIGPVMTEALHAHGITPHIIPKHPKMPSLVIAAAEGAPA